MNHRLLAASLAGVLMLCLSGSAGAVDGAIEINQPKVLASGGFPYTISTAGSYRLTGNLTATGGGVVMIQITVPNVSIDLNGFAIIGPGGTGIGISAASQNQIEVKNGSISSFFTGVTLGNNGTVRDVRAVSNAEGIDVGSNSLVDGCAADSNSNVGIKCTGSACVISGNVANHNSDGVECTGSGCTISGNVISSNSDSGVLCDGFQCSLLGNAANSNTNYGFSLSHSGNLVIGNVVGLNGLFGLHAADNTTGYGENVFQSNNSGGAQVSGGTSLGAGNTNMCDLAQC